MIIHDGHRNVLCERAPKWAWWVEKGRNGLELQSRKIIEPRQRVDCRGSDLQRDAEV